MPGIVLQIPHSRSSLRANLCGERVWIRFVDLIIAIARFDVVFVARSLTDIGYEALPNARRGWAHAVCLGIPTVELSDHRNQLRIRRPDGKVHAATPTSLRHVSSELLVGAVMSAFRKQVQVEFTQGRLHHARSLTPYYKFLALSPRSPALESLFEIQLRRNLTQHTQNMRRKAFRRKRHVVPGTVP